MATYKQEFEQSQTMDLVVKGLLSCLGPDCDSLSGPKGDSFCFLYRPEQREETPFMHALNIHEAALSMEAEDGSYDYFSQDYWYRSFTISSPDGSIPDAELEVAVEELVQQLQQRSA